MKRLNSFFALYPSRRNTKKTYKSGLKCYFQTIYNSEEPAEQLTDKYFTENRECEADIQRARCLKLESFRNGG
jgi:hypothetical protein